MRWRVAPYGSTRRRSAPAAAVAATVAAIRDRNPGTRVETLISDAKGDEAAAAEIARLKGQMGALVQAATLKRCNITTRDIQ